MNNSATITQSTPPNNYLRLSFSTPLNLSLQSLTSIFERVWQVIELYKLDPSPEVSQQALAIYNDIQLKAFTTKENCLDTYELPSPTNRQKYLLNESPIASSAEFFKETNENVNKHFSGRVSVSAISSPYLPHSNNHANFMNLQYTMKRKIFGKDPLSNDKKEQTYSNGNCDVSKESLSSHSNSMSESYQACRKPLISTTFVDWCTKQFSQPCSHAGICCCANTESNCLNTIAEWRLNMIQNQYLKAKTELLEDKPNMKFKRLKKSTNYLTFHPFEEYLALADDYTFSIWNYSEESYDTETFVNDKQQLAKITDLHIINTHGKALLMVASGDSSIRVWRDVFPLTFPEISTDEYSSLTKQNNLTTPKLSTAFFMFEDLPLRTRPRKRVVISWNEQKFRLIAGGDNKYIRIWDVINERKFRDISVGSDVVTSVSSDSNHLICVGCEDGVVRIFDDRVMLNDGRVLSFSSRMSPVVNAKLWPYTNPNQINMVSGHQSGDICWYDKRHATKAVRIENNEKFMQSMDFHNSTDVFAW